MQDYKLAGSVSPFNKKSRRSFLTIAGGSLLAGCSQRYDFFEGAPLNGGEVRRVVLATNRTAQEDGPAREDDFELSLLSVETAEGRSAGELAFSGKDAFALATEEPVDDGDLRQALLRSSQDGSDRSQGVAVWIHGFNNTPGEAVARQVQILQDLGHTGPAVSFVWPSRGAGNGYVFDRDSALFSRRVLADFLLELRAAWSGPIIVIAHSLGGFLTMEALARLRLEGYTGDIVDGLVLVQPDISPDVFAEQARDAAPLPNRSVLMVSQVDPALRLSAFISGQSERLGSTAEPEQYRELGIQVVDLSDVPDADNNHLTAFTSPTVLAQLRRISAEARRTFTRR